MKPVDCTIITIGNELLFGETVDTNSAFMARLLTEAGVCVREKVSVSDKVNEIVKAVRRVKSPLLLLTGGLGPTQDDLTRNALARAFSVKLFEDERQKKRLIRFFRKVKRPPVACNFRQVLVPEGFKAFDNPYGTAPLLFKSRPFLFALPGVPHEMEGLMRNTVMPKIRKCFKLTAIQHREIKTSGIGESLLQQMIEDLIPPPDVTLAFLPDFSGVTVRVSGVKRPALSFFANKIRGRLKEYVYGARGQSLESLIKRNCIVRKMRLSVAESCTGGRISGRLTILAGSSNFFTGGVIAYSDELKQRLINVPASILREKGAVSSECALAMARGVRKRTETDIALSVTGIAGPSGGSPEKPVGTVYTAVVTARTERVERFLLLGDRNVIQERAVTVALNLLWRTLKAEK